MWGAVLPRTRGYPAGPTSPATLPLRPRSLVARRASDPLTPTLSRKGRGGRNALGAGGRAADPVGAWGRSPHREKKSEGGWVGQSGAQRTLVRDGGVGGAAPRSRRAPALEGSLPLGSMVCPSPPPSPQGEGAGRRSGRGRGGAAPTETKSEGGWVGRAARCARSSGMGCGGAAPTGSCAPAADVTAALAGPRGPAATGAAARPRVRRSADSGRRRRRARTRGGARPLESARHPAAPR